MGRGLERLGLAIHAQCDDHHPEDWLERVILPSIAFDESVRPRIAAGVAAYLDTSRAHLEFLCDRAFAGRLAALGSWPEPHLRIG